MRIVLSRGYDRAMRGTRPDQDFATDLVLAVVLFAAALMSVSGLPVGALVLAKVSAQPTLHFSL